MIKVSTTGMAVSLKTDLRFPISGQWGHGDRIIQLCDNQMTIILSYLPKRIQVLFLSESSFFYNAEDIYQLVRNVEWYFHIAL